MDNIDDVLADTLDRDNLLAAAKSCDSGLLLYYDDHGRMCQARFGLTWASQAYLLAGAQAVFSADLVARKKEVD